MKSTIFGIINNLLSAGFLKYGGSIKDNTAVMVSFSTVSGGGVAVLTGDNFWEGAATAFYVSLLNHTAHKMTTEDNVRINTKDKTVEVERTKDDYDKIFVDGEEVLATPKGGLGQVLRDNGFKINMVGPQGVGMGLTDFVLDAFNVITGAYELKMGVKVLSKKDLLLKVFGRDTSRGTLQSSVYYKSILGAKEINLFGGRIKRLPYLSVYGVGRTHYWSSFMGRNTLIFGGSRTAAGTGGLMSN